MSLCLFTRRLLWSFCVVILPWYFILLEVVCIAVFTFGTQQSSSHLLRSLLMVYQSPSPVLTNDLQETDTFHSPAERFWRYLRLSMGTTAPHFLWQNFKAVCLLWILQKKQVCADSLFCFPKDDDKSQVCGLSPAHRLESGFSVLIMKSGSCSVMSDSATPWTVQAPLSMEFFKQECWSR